jgi:hypothetical protein
MKFITLITASLGLLVSTTKALPVTSNGFASRADDIKTSVKVPSSTSSCNHDSPHPKVARSEDTKEAEDMQIFGSVMNWFWHGQTNDKAAESKN